jgi:hypothetical protein
LRNSHSYLELLRATLGILMPPFFARRLRFLYWALFFAFFVLISQITTSTCPVFTLRSASCSALSLSEYTDMKGEGIWLHQSKWFRTISWISEQSHENFRVDLLCATMPLPSRCRAHEDSLSTRKNVVGARWPMTGDWWSRTRRVYFRGR